MHTLADDAGSNALYEAMNFTQMGIVRDYYKIDGKPRDAFVWAQAYNPKHQLVQYLPPDADPEGVADLLNPRAVPKPKRRFPPWAVSCFLNFGLPILVVFVMFLISYALVLLGPLRGLGHVATDSSATSNISDEHDL